MIMRLAAARVRDLRVFVDGLDDSAVKRLTAALNQIDFAADTEPLRSGGRRRVNTRRASR